MKMKKQLLALLLAAVMVLSLTGCKETLKKVANPWIPIAERLPETDDYILISFENFNVPQVGRYEADEDGCGEFYPGDEDFTYKSIDLYVNAWMPLPKPYRQ